MEGRGFTVSGEYRYGFNGQEKDGEIGDYYSFEYRIHHTRLGRFLSVDPLFPKFAYNSPYAFAENRVIDGIEFEGLEVYLIGGRMSSSAGFAITGEIGIIFDMNGNLTGYTTGYVGVETNISVSFELSITCFLGMNTYSDALGLGASIGVNFGEGFVGGVNLVGSATDLGICVHAGWGIGLSPLSAEVGVSFTVAEELSKEQEKTGLIFLMTAVTELQLKLNEYEVKIIELEVDNSNIDYEIEEKHTLIYGSEGAISEEEKTKLLNEIDGLNRRKKSNNEKIEKVKEERDIIQQMQYDVLEAAYTLTS